MGNRIFFAAALAFVAGCSSTGDYRRAQARLGMAELEDRAVRDASAAAKSYAPACDAAKKLKLRNVVFSEQDGVMRQAKRPAIYGSFQAFCADVPEGSTVEIVATSTQQNGGLGQPYFLVPKVTILDEKFEVISDEALTFFYDDGILGAKITGQWSAATSSKRVYVVVEADNRDETMALDERDKKGNPPPLEDQMRRVGVPVVAKTAPFGKIRLSLTTRPTPRQPAKK